MKYLFLFIILINSTYSQDFCHNPFENMPTDIFSMMGDDDEGIPTFSGGGGDLNHTADNVWFMGKKKVHYCISKADSYPLSTQDLETLVKESIGQWVSFFKKYEINSKGLFLPKRPEATLIAEVVPTLSTEFKYQGACEQEDNNSEKLHLYFGIANKYIEAYKHFSTENALGLAIRASFNHKTLRNGGYIWVDHFSNDVKRIKHMLLHELGHMFGMPHDSVFVMNEDIAYELKNTDHFNSDYFGSIESPSWVYRIKQAEPLVLTSLKGIRFKPNRPNPCRIKDFKPNKSLPIFIRKNLRLPERGCHKISLNLLKKEKKNNYFELSIETRRKNYSIKGILRPEREALFNPKGPTVFTAFRPHPNDNKVIMRKGIFDPIPPETPAKGSFKIMGQNYATKLGQDKGLQLEIFFSKENRWWTLSTSHKK